MSFISAKAAFFSALMASFPCSVSAQDFGDFRSTPDSVQTRIGILQKILKGSWSGSEDVQVVWDGGPERWRNSGQEYTDNCEKCCVKDVHIDDEVEVANPLPNEFGYVVGKIIRHRSWGVPTPSKEYLDDNNLVYSIDCSQNKVGSDDLVQTIQFQISQTCEQGAPVCWIMKNALIIDGQTTYGPLNLTFSTPTFITVASVNYTKK